MRITDVEASDESLVQAIAAMLEDGFRQNAPEAFPDLRSAIAEVRESFAPDRVSRVAVDDQGTAVGWISGIKDYNGHSWELHPLVVRPDRQRRGIGRALVRDLEQRVVALGGSTIYLGTDDEQSQTSIAGVDLYPNVWQHVRNIRNFRDHPYEFYQKLGFVIVGVIPDANGFGKPDILMAKRVGPKEAGVIHVKSSTAISATSSQSGTTTYIPASPDCWQVVGYEVGMFRATREILSDQLSTLALRNAIVESQLLHTRNLCEILLPDSEKRTDDIKLTDLFGNWSTNIRYGQVKAAIDQIRAAYGKSSDQTSPRWAFNKRLAHPTQSRAAAGGHDYTGLVALLEPMIRSVFDQFEALRGTAFRPVA